MQAFATTYFNTSLDWNTIFQWSVHFTFCNIDIKVIGTARNKMDIDTDIEKRRKRLIAKSLLLHRVPV